MSQRKFVITAALLCGSASMGAHAQLAAGQIYGGSVQFNNICSNGGAGYYSQPIRVVAQQNGDAQYLFTNITSSGTDNAGDPIPQGGITVLTYKTRKNLWSSQTAIYDGTYNGYSEINGSWTQTFMTGAGGVVMSTGTFNIFNSSGEIVCTEPTNGTFIPLPKGL